MCNQIFAMSIDLARTVQFKTVKMSVTEFVPQANDFSCGSNLALNVAFPAWYIIVMKMEYYSTNC